MKKGKESTKEKGIERRTFLKLVGGIALMLSTLAIKVKNTFAYWATPWKITGFKNYWKGPEEAKYFVHRTVYNGMAEEGYIFARIDNWWRGDRIREAEEKFKKWWISDMTLEKEEGWPLMVGGAVLPIYATYGNKLGRGDSQFHLNCACKGATFVPNKEHIRDIIDELKARITDPEEERDEWMHGIFKDRSLWDYSKISTIEIFTNPHFETHSFLNMMENPITNICFLGRTGFEHFELRCITKLLCWNDPNLTQHERDISEFTNWFHCFPFGAATYPTDLICDVFYIIEEFDNFPYTACGGRVVPPFEYEHV